MASVTGRRLSVVIPVKDDAVPLAACLRTLEAQRQPPHEVIVVDNGSADGSREVAITWGARLLSEPAPGIGAAAATGYDTATGDLIARLDADTQLGPGWTARALRDFAELPDLDGVTGPAVFTGCRGGGVAAQGGRAGLRPPRAAARDRRWDSASRRSSRSSASRRRGRAAPHPRPHSRLRRRSPFAHGRTAALGGGGACARG